MERDHYQYIFDSSVPFGDVVATLDLALIAVESTHGECRARLLFLRLHFNDFNRLNLSDSYSELDVCQVLHEECQVCLNPIWCGVSSDLKFIERRVLKGDRGSFMLFGRDTDAHQMLAEHLTAERGVAVESKGRKVEEWKAVPGRDNHLFDCLVGCTVAASLAGAALTVGGGPLGKRKPRRRIRLSEWRVGRSEV